jgi:hypothetical protein
MKIEFPLLRSLTLRCPSCRIGYFVALLKTYSTHIIACHPKNNISFSSTNFSLSLNKIQPSELCVSRHRLTPTDKKTGEKTAKDHLAEILIPAFCSESTLLSPTQAQTTSVLNHHSATSFWPLTPTILSPPH